MTLQHECYRSVSVGCEKRANFFFEKNVQTYKK
jgi:hypothetical protein